ncbi:diguanylate cyclase domain-containing protein, partial [Escherichia coli]
HKVGDAVLVAFAGVLRSLIRRDDVAARWGGEEFALLLREHEPQRLLALLERLLAAVREMTPVGRLPSLRCSTSAGVVLALPGDS